MARKRSTILILLSLVLGVGAVWVANSWVAARTAARPAAQQASVVVAAMDVPFGTKLEARHLKTMEVVPGHEPSGSFHEVKDVEGKVTTAAMLTGEIVLRGRLVDSTAGSALAAIVDKSMRAVTVRVDDVVGVAGFLLPGNRVDVVAARKEKERYVTETILFNLPVLAVDQTASTDKNEPVVVRAVTLQMTPAQAETLVRGRAEGTIQLTLRNPLDDALPVAPPTKPAPPPQRLAARYTPAPKAPEIQIIRGTQVRSSEAKLD
jgi:pilus assembly protein CpaB